MTRSATYQIRIDEVEKQETFAILHELGLTPAQAVKMFFAQVRSTHSIPFPIERKPNAKTIKAIEESERGENLVMCKDAADLFDKLGI
ncbi:MAG TPA: type II toxin-antitoxin system RelB/DinJ family antitoxin [Aquirhabdus sp.]